MISCWADLPVDVVRTVSLKWLIVGDKELALTNTATIS